MPGLLEPLDHGLRDRRADALGGGELGLGRRADRSHRSELLGQRPRRGGAHVADRQRHQHPPQRHPRGLRQVVEQPLAVGAELGTVLTLLGRAGEQRRPQQLAGIEVEDIALVGDHLGVEQRDRRLVAQALDVERTAPGDVEDPLAHLRGTEPVVGAAAVLVALLLLHQRGATGGAVARSDPGREALGAQREHRAEDLGDHVAGLAQDDRVAGAHVLALDLVVVVQRGVLDGRAGDLGRLHDAVRRHAAGAADVDPDLQQLGVDLLGRVLEGDRPPGRAAGRAEAALEGHIVDLDHDAVDLVGHDRVAVLAGVGDVALDLGEGRHDPDLVADRQAPGGERLVGVRLGLRLEAAPLTDAVADHPQRAGGRDPGVLLAQ